MRLISFLGNSKYSPARYELAGKSVETPFVARALADLEGADEVLIILTEEAKKENAAKLEQALAAASLPAPRLVLIPTEGNAANLRQLFGVLVEAIRDASGPVLLDITHGFRMQPFFAAACIQYVQAVLPRPPIIRVVYAEYRPGNRSPIWELTEFLDVLTWSRELMMFLRTGVADGVAEPMNQLGRTLSREWANSGKNGPKPELARLAGSLQKFSDDFTTIRTGDLLQGEHASARKLEQSIAQTRDEVAQHIPAVSAVLDQVQGMVQPLVSQHPEARFSQGAGQRTMLALARLYQSMGRYSEAISVLREGWITLGAPANCDLPGREFKIDDRKALERTWSEAVHQSRQVAEIRNDIQHAGFQTQPNKKGVIAEHLEKLLKEWEAAIAASEAIAPG